MAKPKKNTNPPYINYNHIPLSAYINTDHSSNLPHPQMAESARLASVSAEESGNSEKFMAS